MAVASSLLPLGTPLPSFRLPDSVTGNLVGAEDFGGRILVVAFLCNHCPYVQHILSAVVDFGRSVREAGVAVVGISSNDVAMYPQDGPPQMKELATERGFPFPYLFDETQDVARAFRAECTPEFFLFDAAGRLAYRGQFDGSRPKNDVPPTGESLRAAVGDVLAGREPSPDQRPSIGCSIKWRVP